MLLKATVPLRIPLCVTSLHQVAASPTMICAGYKEGGVDLPRRQRCPLVWRTPDGPVLVGVVSFGEGCAQKLKWGGLHRVSAPD